MASLKVLRLGSRWDLAFHQALKRDAKGDIIEFDLDPGMVEQFGTEASTAIRERMDKGHSFVLVDDAGGAALCSNGRRTPVCDSAGSVASRNCPRRRDQVAWNDLVSTIGSDTVLSAFILFCRIGACLMLMPGFSSPRIPTTVRLFLAVAITLAFVPLLGPDVEKLIDKASPLVLLRLIVSETLIGGLIGFMGRIFFAALETLGTAIAQEMGLANSLGAPIDEMEPIPTIASLADLLGDDLALRDRSALGSVARHRRLLPGFADRRRAFRRNSGWSRSPIRSPNPFLLSLRIASPFIVFALIVNLGIGLANRLTPQIHGLFHGAPLVVFAGLVLFYFTFRQLYRAVHGRICGLAEERLKQCASGSNRLQRLLSVQKDMHRLAEWRFATLERQLAAMREEQKRLVSYLDDDRLFTLAYTGTIVERLRTLDEA